MEYCVGYCWQKRAEEDTGLLLQQLKGRKRKKDVLFAVVCRVEREREATEYVLKTLQDWFRYEGLEKCKGKRMEEIEKGIQNRLESLVEELGTRKSELAGILCVAERFWSFGGGGGESMALQRRFGRSNMHRIGTKDGFWVREGRLQAGVGILLSTAGFAGFIEQKELEEISDAEADEKTMQKRLCSVGNCVAERSGRWQAAVLIHYRESIE